MRKYLFGFVFASTLAATASQAGATSRTAPPPPFDIELVEVKGSGCTEADVVTVQKNVLGEYFIDAKFFQQSGEGFAAETSGTQTTDRKDCTIRYNLKLKPGYKLDVADFLVDGEYDLSELGTGSISVRYHVPGVGTPNIAFASFRPEDGPATNAFQLAGDIEVNDNRVNYCGATIPLEIQVKGTARRGRDDARDSYVRIDNGEGQTAVKGSRIRCGVTVRPCR